MGGAGSPSCKYIFFVLLFCLLLHRLAVRISLPFHIYLRSLKEHNTNKGKNDTLFKYVDPPKQ